MPARMTTPEIQSNDIWCGLTPSWKVGAGKGEGGGAGQEGGERGGRGGVKKLNRISFISYFPFVLEL